MSISDTLTAIGLVIAVWLAALTFRRTEIRAIIDRTITWVQAADDLMIETWCSGNFATTQNIDARVLESRLLHACERIERLSSLAAKRLKTKDAVIFISAAMVEITNAATLDIQSRASESAANRIARYYRFRRECVAVSDYLDEAFDSKQNKYWPF